MARTNLTCALLAHVDAGKTTLAEALLCTAGVLRSPGRVDHGDSFLDTDVQERERGITIFTKQALFPYRDVDICFLDTPGHVDFSGETERALRVLDCAVLIIGGANGVQGHTLTLWKLLEKHNIPVYLFVNKMDQPGCERSALMENLRRELSPNCVDMEGDSASEEIATCDEAALNRYLEEGSLPREEIRELIYRRKFFPCYFGSALKMQGVEVLLDALTMDAPRGKRPEAFGAKVYKIERDAQGNRLTCMKITGGVLKVRSLLTNRREDIPPEKVWEEKVTQLRLYSGPKYTTVEEVTAGGICAVTGLTQTYPGQGLGFEEDGPGPDLCPVFTYRVLLPRDADPHVVLQKLRILEEEDPLLHVIWQEEKKEIHIRLMGEIQLEILSRLMKERFGIGVEFGEGSILYRETIENTVEGIGHYEPLRHYAEVHLLLKPGERGSGIFVQSNCPEDELDRNWQRLIMTHVLEKQHCGVLTGSPVTDLRITLIAGRAHLKHTEGGDFRQATYRAIRQGLMQARSLLLEPWYHMRLEIPAEHLGRALADISQMGGVASAPQNRDMQVILEADAPVEKARHYARNVAAYTKGRGHISFSFGGYKPCSRQAEIVETFGYRPEADLENSPDSIFCGHGAGFPVKWDQVRQYMHIDTGVLQPKPAVAPSRGPKGAKSYSGSLEEDKELMAIYERTYGPIKPRSFQPVVKNPVPQPQSITLPEEPSVLLVDGYNIIFAWDELKQLAACSLEDARRSLMDILCNYQGVKGCEVILVFDGYKVSGNLGEAQKYRNITVVYTREAQTADSYIEQATHSMGKKYNLRVASSDRLEQFIILGNGAMRVSAQEFHREVENTNAEIRNMLSALNRQVCPSGNMETALHRAWQKKKEAGQL